MFKGCNFVFNDIPSEKFGLKIGFLNESSLKNTYSGISQSIEEEKIKRVDKPVFFGIEKTGKISFEMLIYSETEIDTYDRQAIDMWLFQNTYKMFQIDQDDYNGIFFNCIITNATKTEVGKTPYAKKVTVICDSPYVYTDEYLYSASVSPSSSTTLTISNLSNLNDYSYPIVEITMGSTSGDITLNNLTENRATTITGLTSGEIITIDNERKILSSSTGINRMGSFNKAWFRLVPYINNVEFSGHFIANIKIRYRMTI